MATDDGSQIPRLKRLEKTGEEYNFFQISRLLESLSTEDEKTVDVKFSGNNSFALKPNFVERVDVKEQENGWDVTVGANGFHLLGHQSPIPDVYLEQIARETQQGNSGPSAFLDIFNNKILRELYELKQRFDPMLFSGQPGEEHLFSLFESVSGVLDKSQFEKKMPKTFQRFWRKFAYQYSNRRISYGLLKQLFTELLSVEVEIEPNSGGWRSLPKEKQAILNGSSSLGNASTLGRRYWSHSNSVTMILRFRQIEDYKQHLPGSDEYSELVALVAVLVDLLFDVRLELMVEPTRIPKCKLNNQVRLGYTSWLRSTERELVQADSARFCLGRKEMLAGFGKDEGKAA